MHQNWSKEIYIITHLVPTNPPRYILKDLEDVAYTYKFYAQELQKFLIHEFPYDSYKVLDETTEQVFIEKLNSDKEKNWINKKEFFEK